MVKNKMCPVHPGEILREEYIVPMGMSVHALSQALRVPATRLHEIVKGRRSITQLHTVRPEPVEGCGWRAIPARMRSRG